MHDRKSVSHNYMSGVEMGMMVRRDEAVETLGDARLAILKQCLDEAWATFDRSFRSALPLCSPVGMANILRELVIQQVRERFVGVDGVDIRDNNVVGGRFLAEIDRRLILSFKKLTKDFQTTNNPTETSRAFDTQEPGIEGMPDLPRITVGYQLGQYGTSIAGMWLAFVVGKECVWHHDLQTGAGSIEIEFPRDEESAAEKERRASERQIREQREAERRKRVQGDDGPKLRIVRDGDDPEGAGGG